jgi:hypothetical protein
MAAIIRPVRSVSFSDLNRVAPDRLDAQIQNLIDAIHSTQKALADIRRDDGKLRNSSVGPDQLAVQLRHSRKEIDSIEQRIIQTAQAVGSVASQMSTVTRDVELRAKDAENAAFSAMQSMSDIAQDSAAVVKARDAIVNANDTAETWADDAQNWADFAQAQAQNAQADQEQAAGWAEFLAGPVVNPADAPAYIAGTPWGHGLYYQPVEGGLAGLWSAKWWALYAQQLVGHWNFYYLGAWPTAPFPGQTNPDTGLTTPNPLAPGSFYYNTQYQKLYIWDGTQWTSPTSLSPAYQQNYIYNATAGQKAFSGPDRDGKVPSVATGSGSDVHLNGVKLVPTTDFTVDQPTSTLHLIVGAPAGAVVQWDLLLPVSDLAPGAISVFKIMIAPTPNGTNTAFTMTYNHPTLGAQPVAATQVAEVAVSLDGIVQEPAVDFSVAGANLTFSTAPLLGAHIWGTWHASDLIIP